MRQNFVLVHIHRQIFPKYIYTCIEQLRLTNQEAEIYLAFFSSCDDVDYDRLKVCDCHLIDLKRQLWSMTHFRFKLKNRGIFYTERFYVLYEIMKQYKLSNVIHIENDVMVYMDINKIMPVLREKYDLGFVRESDKICIAAFVYIKNAAFLKPLCKYFLTAEDVNDMVGISVYGYRARLRYLPVIGKDYMNKEDMKNSEAEWGGTNTKDPSVYCENVEELQCIFDGAAYGQYVGGVDTRGKGKPEDTIGVINKVFCHSAGKCKIVWEFVDGLRVPFYVYGEDKLPIVNLHIHSKQLEKYRSDI
ncbi:MAG: hypothetical protein NC131_20350 [Roseburia sp.]|nr:hypothetical protein [Roseburia sp.]